MDEYRVFGAIPSPKDDRDYTVNAAVMGSLPKSCFLPETKIRNQGSVGSCVAHTIASAQDMEGDYFHSIKAIYGHREKGQNIGIGMIPREALKNTMEWGNVPYDMLPGNTEMQQVKNEFEAMRDKLATGAQEHRIKGYARVYGAGEMKAAIAAGMPVALTVRWFDEHTVNANGIMLWGGGNYIGNHELLVTGYDGDYFVIQNSWGESWGEKGKCRSHATGLFSAATFIEAWAIDLGCKAKKDKPDVIRRTLKKGMSGEDVKGLQEKLMKLGYSVGDSKADGIFGKNTKAAVCAYQLDSGLVSDGIVGKNTWAALDKENV